MDVIAKLDGKVDAHRAEAKADAAKLEAKVDKLDARMEKGFSDLDKELTGHAALHREIEKDIEALKARPARTAARATRQPRTR